MISLGLSRFREREADYIGLLLMADAGFNLSGAVSFWTKLNKWEEQQQRGAKKRVRREPQFRSTHPHVSWHPFLVLLGPSLAVHELETSGVIPKYGHNSTALGPKSTRQTLESICSFMHER